MLNTDNNKTLRKGQCTPTNQEVSACVVDYFPMLVQYVDIKSKGIQLTLVVWDTSSKICMIHNAVTEEAGFVDQPAGHHHLCSGGYL